MSEDIALELERLRGVCSAGFAEIKGALAVLVERSDRSEEDIQKLEHRFSALERRVWMTAGIGVAVAVGSSGLLTSLLVR